MLIKTVRIVALIALFAETYLVGIVPLYLLKKWNNRISSHIIPFANELEGRGSERASLSSNAVIQVLLQFGGGVLLATVFTHLLPEIKEHYEDYLKTNESIFKTSDGSEDKWQGIPFVEIAICFGFFLIFLVEELMHTFLNRFNEHQNKHQNCYNRDLMNRCSSLCADTQENNCPTETKPFSAAFVNYGADLSSSPSFDKSVKKSIQMKADVMPNRISTVCEESEPRISKSVQISTETGNSSEDSEKSSLIIMFFRGLVIIFAFSVHSIFDGLAIGLQTTATDLWSMFFAISVHKLVIAFVVSLQLFDQSHRIVLVAIHMALFAVMSPIGIFIVILSENSLLGEDSESNPIVILLTSIATGTLMYIIFYEILQKDRCERISGFVQFLSILVGFLIMLTINILLAE